MRWREIGITATRDGLTVDQARAFRNWLMDTGGERYHHGSCKGGDAQAHRIIRDLPFKTHVTLHMPTDLRQTEPCDGDDVREPFPYLERNHNIVNECTHLIGLPNGMREQLRSGTWATLRYARKIERSFTIIWPDGSRSISTFARKVRT